MAKYLGLDYGLRKIGLALADTEVGVAMPFKVLSAKEFNLEINNLIQSEAIDKLIVGLPLGLKGKETNQTKDVQDFIKSLKDKTAKEVVAFDERLSTIQAKKQQAEALGHGPDDALAAMNILQTYLDKNN